MGGEKRSVDEALARRADVLAAVGDGASRADLSDALGVSESTIDRALGELVEARLAESTSNGYRWTVAGRLAMAVYDRFVDSLDRVEVASELFSCLPAGVSLDPDALVGADVVLSTSENPEKPLNRTLSTIEGASHVDFFADVLVDHQVHFWRTRILRFETSARAVMTADVLAGLVSEHGEALADVLDLQRFRVRQATSLPYTLVVADRADGPEVALLVSDGGVVCGGLFTAAPAAIEWTREEFERRWAGADPLPRRRNDGADE